MLHSGTVDGQTPLINSLPPEILSDIFLHLRQIRRYRQLLPFQVSTSHVCRRWRQIAISTPQLWSTITVFSTRSLPCVDEWLRRSGAAPLGVRLDLYSADYRGQVDVVWIKETLARIASNVHRLRNLFIFAYREVNAYHILQLFEHADAPLLERLSVHIGNRDDRRELAPLLVSGNNFTLSTTFNGGLPRLAFAELEPLRCIPPLTNITTLYLNVVGKRAALHFDRLAEILQTPYNLVTFSLRGNIKEDGWPIHRDRPHIQLPQLRNLELSARGVTGVWFILFFGAPNLESLRWHVSSDNYHQLLDSPQFQPGVIKFPALKYLTLVGQPLSPRHLEILMEIFPTPTHILYSHPLFLTQTPPLSALFGTPGWANLQVLAVQRIFEPHSERLALEMRRTLRVRPNIEKVLADRELLSYLEKHTPDLQNLVELDELNGRTFPDYWWISRNEETPDRL